jgi:hypothetical protein
MLITSSLFIIRMDGRLPEGGNGVIHIGFLSRGKTLSLNRFFSPLISGGFFGLRLWPAVLPRTPNVPKRPRSFDLLRTWEFLFD